VAAGLTVHGTAGSAAGRDLVAAQGAAKVADHGAPGYAAELLALTDGRGYDVIVEMAAQPARRRSGAAGGGGRVVVVGSRGPVEIAPRDLMSRDADVRGMLLFIAAPQELAEAYRAIGVGLGAGKLHPVIAHELPLADAPRAHREILAGPASASWCSCPEAGRRPAHDPPRQAADVRSTCRGTAVARPSRTACAAATPRRAARTCRRRRRSRADPIVGEVVERRARRNAVVGSPIAGS